MKCSSCDRTITLEKGDLKLPSIATNWDDGIVYYCENCFHKCHLPKPKPIVETPKV